MSGLRAVLFVDRDGTLIEEPPDLQIDCLDKVRLVPGVIHALRDLCDAGFELVMVSNQDGLGTASFPRELFEGPQAWLLAMLESQGITFREILIDTTLAADNAPTRKPGIGLVMHYLRDRGIDWARCAMIGDRSSDMQFAEAMGVRGFQLRSDRFGGDCDWAGIRHALLDSPRVARVERTTRETEVCVAVDLDRIAMPTVSTGLGFFDHMLQQLGSHGGFALDIRTRGDLGVDEHHTVEDTAIALGTALRDALGDKRGLQRYGFTLPMDEALASAVLDLSGRACMVFDGQFSRDRVGDLPTELVPHFFRSLCDAGGINLHLQVRGDNDHHRIEACFKAVARALRMAIRREGSALPSTKGSL